MNVTTLVPSASVGMTVLAAFAILGPVAAWWLASRRRTAGVLAGLLLLPILVLTLTPSRRSVTFGCAIDWSPQLTAPEPLANVLMLVPFALALAVATGKPLRAALAGSALSFGIELVQAVVTPIGRSCDTSDWIANTAGSLIGAGLAAIGIGFDRWQRRQDEAHATRPTTRDTQPQAW